MQISDLPSIRVNQTGYAAGLPVHIAVIADAEVCLRDAKGNTIKKRGINVEKRSWDSVTAALIKGLYYQRCALEETPGNTPIPPAIRPLRLIGSSDFSRSSFVFYCVTALKYLLFSSFSTISA